MTKADILNSIPWKGSYGISMQPKFVAKCPLDNKPAW